MVADQFPVFKLATLLARQMSSPIASRIKRYAVSHPRFGAAVCRRVARLYARGEWRARELALRLAGTRLPRDARAPPLPERVAQDLGGDLLGEIIIFTLGALIVIFEVNRQANKQEAKVLERRSQWLAVSLSLRELQQEVALQQRELERLHAALRRLLQTAPAPAPSPAPTPAPAPAPATGGPAHLKHGEPERSDRIDTEFVDDDDS